MNMYNNDIVIENFINFCDNMIIAEEGYRDTDIMPKQVKISFFGKDINICVDYINIKNPEESKKMLDRFIKYKPWENKKMWSEIYKNGTFLWNDVNSDPYFDGRKVNSSIDLITAVQEGKPNYIQVGNYQIMLSGRWWIDPEHGWSIIFPKGRYIPQKDTKIKYGYPNNVTYLIEGSDFQEGV